MALGLDVFVPIGIDMYLPALPTIAREFGAPVSAIEHSLAAFFLGMCLGLAACTLTYSAWAQSYPSKPI
jgi:DHA1 family bicyclomycin/chloramphenicol resistance-like MFS transporter